MSKKMMQKVLGKGLVVAMLVAIAAVALGKVESVHAENKSIRLGESVVDYVPEVGEKIHWYKFEASPGTMVRITMNRQNGDLQPYIALRAHDGQDYVIVASNEGYSGTAQVAALLPVTHNGYWIEAASVHGASSGLFELTLATDSIRNQAPAKSTVGYNVTLTIDKIICWDDQDDDGTDELDFRYSMREYAPTAAVNGPESQRDFWMQPTWEADNFLPLEEQIARNSSVQIAMKLKEDDLTSGDETLLNDSFKLSWQELESMAASGGAESYFYQPAQYSNGEAYTYEIFFTVRVESISGLDIN